jgi:hypothetical protein
MAADPGSGLAWGLFVLIVVEFRRQGLGSRHDPGEIRVLVAHRSHNRLGTFGALGRLVRIRLALGPALGLLLAFFFPGAFFQALRDGRTS